jgi:hypothetical protein
MKMILAAILVLLLFVALLLHRKRNQASRLILFVYRLCLFAVVGLGYFGGEIVFGTPTHADPAAKKVARAGEPKEEVSFSYVSDILNHHCIMCHKGNNAPLGLQLDSYEHVMAGGENGLVVVPGRPQESELVLRIKGQIKPSMPFGKPLLQHNNIQSVIRWVEEGAPKE